MSNYNVQSFQLSNMSEKYNAGLFSIEGFRLDLVR